MTVFVVSATGAVPSTRDTLAEEGVDGNATVPAVEAPPADTGSEGACEWPEVPKTIKLKEKFWAFLQTVTVDAADGSESLGYVQSSAFAWDNEQRWYDKNGKELAFSRHSWAQTSSIFFRDSVHVEDCNKRDMGEISDDLQSSGLSEVNLLTISAPGGKIVATSTSIDNDQVVNIIDADTGKKMATVHRTKGWGPTDSWELTIDPESSASGNVAADPRMLVLALAAESSSILWGFGAAGFLGIMAFFISICVCLCIHMMRNADPKDPRYGILAIFDSTNDHYEEIPPGIPAGGLGRHNAVAGAAGGAAPASNSAMNNMQGGYRLGYT